jgi:hypothetical protein
MWNSNHIIISSDHWLRRSDGTDHRVPFIVKLAGTKSSVSYDKSFNTVISRALIVALLKKEVASYQDLVRWISYHGKQFEVE